MAKALAAEGAELRMLVRKSSNLANIEGIPGDTHQGDLAEPDSIRSALDGCDAVVHVAADYLAHFSVVVASAAPQAVTSILEDGRRIEVFYRPLPDGGWLETHHDVTRFHREGEAAKDRITLQTLIDWVPDYLWVKDADSQFLVANNAAAIGHGRKTSRDMIGLTDFDLHSPGKALGFREGEIEIMRSGKPQIDQEEAIVDPAGTTKWVSTTKVPLRHKDGGVFGLVGVSRDVTARRLANALREGQAQTLELIARGAPLTKVFDRLVRLIESQLTDVICSILLLDEDGRHLHVSAAPSLPDAYRRAIDGFEIGPQAGSCGTAAYRCEPVIVVDTATDPLWRNYHEYAAAFSLRSCWSTPILSNRGAVLGVFGMYARTVREPMEAERSLIEVATRLASIAIERKLAEDRIQFMATHDALTGLPNRVLLRDRLAQAILSADRCDRCATIAFVDLDNFKVINDTLGHNAGDELLKVVAKRMVACVRASDTIARLGGDEFVILFWDQAKGYDQASETLRRMQTAFAAPIVVNGHALRMTASIGVATFPNDGKDVDALLANADAAMYRAKELGRDCVHRYSPDLNEKVSEKFRLREDLNHALARGEFALLYQPQVNLSANRVFAVEALIRWRHPALGVLSPDRFIPLAEETGLIEPIGEWVLNEACRQNRAWQDHGLPPIAVAVNVSALQFREKRFTAIVAAALRDNGLEPKFLELELTESLIMQDVDRAIATMKELQSLGVRLSIDDFGTGYSSLSALKTFPVTRLKIDKSFICHLPHDAHDKAVATAVISLGQKLNLNVIAEGVETADQVAFLRENQCEEMQGYHFSKPVVASEIERILRASPNSALPE